MYPELRFVNLVRVVLHQIPAQVHVCCVVLVSIPLVKKPVNDVRLICIHALAHVIVPNVVQELHQTRIKMDVIHVHQERFHQTASRFVNLVQ